MAISKIISELNIAGVVRFRLHVLCVPKCLKLYVFLFNKQLQFLYLIWFDVIM